MLLFNLSLDEVNDAGGRLNEADSADLNDNIDKLSFDLTWLLASLLPLLLSRPLSLLAVVCVEGNVSRWFSNVFDSSI